MRVLVLLGVLGLVSANLKFEMGHEYVYKYSGKILTGVPDIDAHFAGIHIMCDMILQAADSTTFKMMLKNVQFAKFDQRLEGPEPKNWRTLLTPATTTVTDPALVTMLESPVVFTMTGGKVTTLKISSLETEWTVNIKKALVGLLKMQEPVAVLDVHHNQVDQSSSLATLPHYFEVMEEGVDGTCKTSYTVTELPAYVAKDPANGYADFMKMDMCTGMKIFHVTKTRDFTKCEKLNMFHTSHAMGKEHKHPTLPRTHTATLLGCGLTSANILLHGAIHEGEMVHKMISFTNEPMITGTMQTLKLYAVKTVMSLVPAIVQPRTVDNILYEWPVMSKSLTEHMIAPFITKGTTTPLATIRTPDTMTAVPELATEYILTDIFTKLTEITSQLDEVEHLQKKQLTSKLMSIAHVFSMLTAEDMKLLLTKINTAGLDATVKKVIMDLTLDVATMTGTHHSVLFLKHMIETEQVSTLKTLNIITTLGHYIRTPTVEMLNHIFSIVKCPTILKNKIIKHNALLNFANLLHKTCISKTKTAHYPTHVFGEFCTATTPEITTTYIPYIVNELTTTTDAEYRETLLISLGTIGHDTVLPILFPYIQGKVAGCTTHLRMVTIMSLTHAVEKHRAVLLPVFIQMLHNPAEVNTVRMAALQMILKTKTNMAQMQKLAIMTWHEKDPEMVKFIYSTLKSLTMIAPEKLVKNKHMIHVVNMAKTVFPLAKPLPGMLFSSMNLFIVEFLEHLDRGYETKQHVHVNPLGNYFMNRFDVVVNKVKIPLLKLFFGLKGEKTLSDQLIQTLTEAITGQVENSNPMDSVHSEWRQIVQDLRIQPRADVPFTTTLYFNAFDDVLAVFGMGQTTLDGLKTKIKTLLKTPSMLPNAICGKTPFHIHKAFNAMPTEIYAATEMGLPLVIEAHQPYLVSLKGDVTVKCDAAMPTVQLTMKNKFIGNNYGHVTTICPFTKELVMAGVDKHIHINKPLKTTLMIEPVKGKLVIQALPEVTPATTAVDVAHYHVKPFTCIRSVTDFTPLTLHPSVKVIHATATPKKVVKQIGQPLGLDLTMVLTHEAELYDLKMLTDRWHLYNYNVFNNILFMWTRGVSHINGMPSNRFVEFTTIYNPTTSTTKELLVNVNIGVAMMRQNEQPIQYKLRSSSGSDQVVEVHSSPVASPKLQTMLTKMNTQMTWAVHTLININLKGTMPKTFTLSTTAAMGGDHVTHKWSIMVDQIATKFGMMNACMDGSFTMPTVPIFSIESLWSTLVKLNFQNKIGFGTTCDQYTVDIVGHSLVSESQKAISRSSSEAVLCQSGHVSQSGQSRHQACNAQMTQAATLDQAEFTISTTGLPPNVFTYLTDIKGLFKILLWKYTTPSLLESLSTPTQLAKVKLQFNTKINTLTVTAITAEETLVWTNIRIPTTFHGILPLVAGTRVTERIHQSVTGSPLRPTCHVTESRIKTYDSHFYTYQLDDCYHLVSSDCSSKFSSAILAKVVSGLMHVRIFHQTSLIEMTPSSSYSSSAKDYVIRVDSQEIRLTPQMTTRVRSDDGLHSFMISRSVDDVITLETPLHKVHYNGMRMEIQSLLTKPSGQLCGLCGDSNLDPRSDLSTPSSCTFKSDLLSALSYRHQSNQCTPLSQSQQDQLSAEEAACSQYKSQMAHRSSQMAQPQMAIGCSLKHATLEKSGETCISQAPVSTCLPGYASQSSIQKLINFTCLSSSNKVTKLYLEKVRRGQILSELSTMDVTYTLPIEMPVYCSQSN